VFESALGRSEASSTRLGTGALLSAGVHALVAALVFVIPGKTKAHQQDEAEPLVIQIAQPQLPAGGGSPAPAAPAPKAEAPAPRPKAAPVQIPDKPVPTPEPKEPPPEPQPTGEQPTGNDQNAANALPGGGEGGSGNGTGSGAGGNGPGTGISPPEPKPTYTEISWNSKLERPVLVGGRAQPEYPRNAMLQRREGVVNARCRITTEGFVRDCRILSGDVMLQETTLETLAAQRYKPLVFEGAPVAVWYTFRFTFKLQ
jgi:periplasmic protein TonB